MTEPLTPESLAELRRLAEAATPGPWFWWGNTDSHSVALCGRQPGLGVREVISTLSVDRSTTGHEADQLRRNLAEYAGMSLGDIEEAVEAWATDEYDQPRTDQRLSITDENYIRRTAEELAVYEVARAQGLPDDTPRDHERIYRADVCDLRATNARYLASANPAVVLALLDAAAERDALAAKIERVRALHYAADNDAARTPICETCHGEAGVHECGCWADRDREPVCGHCNEGHEGTSVPWPCPTIRALDATDTDHA